MPIPAKSTVEILSKEDLSMLLDFFKKILRNDPDILANVREAFQDEKCRGILQSEISFRFCNDKHCMKRVYENEYYPYLAGVLDQSILDEIVRSVLVGCCPHVKEDLRLARGISSTNLLYACVASCNVGLVQLFLETCDYPLQQLGFFKIKPLHVAVCRRQYLMVDFLLSNKDTADLLCNAVYVELSDDGTCNFSKRYPLEMACLLGENEMIKLFLARHNFKERREKFTLNASLEIAVEMGSQSIIQLLGKYGAEPDFSTLCIAVRTNVMQSLTPLSGRLLTQGNKIQVTTLLKSAVKENNAECAQYLFRTGALVELKKKSEFEDWPLRLPIYQAVFENRPYILKIMLDYGVYHRGNYRGYNLADFAVILGFNECKEILARAKIKDNPHHRQKVTPLEVLIMLLDDSQADVDYVVNLVEKALAAQPNYNINQKLRDGNTVLHLAVQNFPDHRDLIAKFIERGADVNARNVFDATPLWVAMDGALYPAIKELIFHNAKLEMYATTPDNSRKTPFQLAVKNDFMQRAFNPLRPTMQLRVKPRVSSQPSYIVTDYAQMQRLVSPVTLLLFCGYDFKITREDVSKYSKEELGEYVYETLHRFRTQPRSLKFLSRNAVRGSIRGKMFLDYVNNINIPDTLKSYLLLNDWLGDTEVERRTANGNFKRFVHVFE